MKFSLITLVTLALLFLGSCTRENVMPGDELANAGYSEQLSASETPSGDSDLTSTMRNGTQCFRFVYPISVAFRDRSIHTLNSHTDLQRLQNSRVGYVFLYPFGIVYPDGTTTRIRNEQDLRNAYTACLLRSNGPGPSRGGRTGR